MDKLTALKAQIFLIFIIFNNQIYSEMRFASLAIVALISSVSAVELQNQAHAKGLKAPHPVRPQLAQDASKENFDWRGMAGAGASMANNALNG